MWYNNWFGTKYYDMLYAKRDETEAESFLNNLVSHLKPKPTDCFLDIGCGKGRHAVYLNSLGYHVTGIDLSSANIEHCKQFEKPDLKFYEHDMRRIHCTNVYGFALNVFTSFGYFEKTHHNQLAINAASLAVKKNGHFIIDYLNSSYVMKNLRSSEHKMIENVSFEITRSLENGFIKKTITVTENEIKSVFYEKVQALHLNDFEFLFQKAGLKIESVFGNYQLDDFDRNHSDRLIVVASKN